MPAFSKKSKARLGTAHAHLQFLFEEVVKHVDCTVLCGTRSKTVQNAAFAAAKSRLKWPDSKHNSDPSLAVDVAPYPYQDKDLRPWYFLAGYVLAVARQYGIRIRWGGDWDMDTDLSDQNFNDLAHYELAD